MFTTWMDDDDDDGIARLKTEIEFRERKKNDGFPKKSVQMVWYACVPRADGYRKCHVSGLLCLGA
jgi:hypothetical protein